MVLAVEEEAASPVAGEQWGRAWGMEMGVGKGSKLSVAVVVSPYLRSPST